jgi:glutamate formiminotransferase/formiminotetrahydrofolate cyclodeaminase
VAAHAGALAAALTQMVVGLTAGRKKYAAVDAEMRQVAMRAAALVNELTALVARDASAYGAVTEAYKLPKEPADAAARRIAAVDHALVGAAEVPLDTARACAAVAELAATAALKGNINAVSDAGVAALLAEAACRGAAYNVRINVRSLHDQSRGEPLAAEAQGLVARTSQFTRQAIEAVDAQLKAD